MTTIQLEIKDSLAHSLGLKAIQEHFKKELELLEIEVLAKKLKASIIDSDINWDDELEQARQEAFSEYQAKR
jgi:hypothetical protein